MTQWSTFKFLWNIYENICPRQILYENISSSFIHNWQKLKKKPNVHQLMNECTNCGLSIHELLIYAIV